MFFCTPCGSKHNWPESYMKSYGPCEVCGKPRECNEVRSDLLQIPYDKMTNEEIFSTWYRSILEDGTLWCESSDPEEVVRMSRGHKVRYERMYRMIRSTDWEPWEPK